MGQSVVVLGAQWGDEGKGKIVDLLTEEIGAVVRFQEVTMLATLWLSMLRKPFCILFHLEFCGMVCSA